MSKIKDFRAVTCESSLSLAYVSENRKAIYRELSAENFLEKSSIKNWTIFDGPDNKFARRAEQKETQALLNGAEHNLSEGEARTD